MKKSPEPTIQQMGMYNGYQVMRVSIDRPARHRGLRINTLVAHQNTNIYGVGMVGVIAILMPDGARERSHMGKWLKLAFQIVAKFGQRKTIGTYLVLMQRRHEPVCYQLFWKWNYSPALNPMPAVAKVEIKESLPPLYTLWMQLKCRSVCRELDI